MKSVLINRPSRCKTTSRAVSNFRIEKPERKQSVQVPTFEVIQTQEDNLLSYYFLYNDGSKSATMQVEIPEPVKGDQGEEGGKGKDGDKGEEGGKGKDGDKGKAAKEIVSVDAYARQWIITFNDGSTNEVPVRFPQDKLDKPGLAFGGERAPVQNIIAGKNIKVENLNGFFTITGLVDSGEDFLDAEDKANLQTVADKLTELVTNQGCQLNTLQKQVADINTHMEIITDEELNCGDAEIFP